MAQKDILGHGGSRGTGGTRCCKRGRSIGQRNQKDISSVMTIELAVLVLIVGLLAAAEVHYR
jgi:hypothetical protein